MYKIGKITTPTVIQQCQSNWTTSPFFRRYIGVASNYNNRLTIITEYNVKQVYHTNLLGKWDRERDGGKLRESVSLENEILYCYCQCCI